jgi:hypothetical protein
MKHLNLIFFYFTLFIFFYNCSEETLNNNTNSNLDPTKYYQELNISYGNDIHQNLMYIYQLIEIQPQKQLY